MSNNARTCPKCGTPLGQKNLCPVCSPKETNTKKAQESPAEPEQEKLVQTLAVLAEKKAADNLLPERLREYQKLKKAIADNPKDFAFVLGTVRTILKDYSDYFQLEHINYFAEMYYAKCPFAILAVLMDPVWSTVYHEYLECVWNPGTQTAKLKQSPFLWSPFYLRDDERRQLQLRETLNHVDGFSNVFGLSFFKCTLTPPFSLSIWGDIYTELKDGTLYQNNPLKPIKHISFATTETEGWQEVVPAGKRVLILYCGQGVEIKLDDESQEMPRTPAEKKEETGLASAFTRTFGFQQLSVRPALYDGFLDLSAPRNRGQQAKDQTSDSGDYRIFTTCDGLQIRRNNAKQKNENEYSILYLVEP